MKKCSWLVLALVAVVALAVGPLEARPGGARPGGARPGGSHLNRAGDFGGGNKFKSGPARDGFGGGQFGKSPSSLFGQKLPSATANSRVGAAQNKFSELQASFSSKNEPFSPAWYADHPAAWQTTHPHADAWAVATIGTAAAWLGIAAAYPASGDTGTVYTSDTGADEDDATPDENAMADENSQADGDESAAQLAARGTAELPNDTQFMPLGVYALAPANHKDATAMVQLSATKDGILRGSYCDLLSDQGQTVFGAIDTKSQRVAWTLGSEGRVVFETTLANLTQARGPVAIGFPGGDTRQFVLARFESPAPAEK